MSADAVSDHYGSSEIAARILAALAAEGIDTTALTPQVLAPLDQFHGRGLEATAEIATMLAPEAGAHLLDIGCGIGGPARWIANRFACRISAVDLTPEFCAAAATLNELTGLSGQIDVQPADALALPFADGCFDGAYAQNVLMNIADKAAFAAEVFRVLKPGGRFVTSVLAVGNGRPLDYPVPWADSEAISFLDPAGDIEAAFAAAGFGAIEMHDARQVYVDFAERARKRIAAEGPPRLGLHILMGESMKDMQRNTARIVADGRVVPLEILACKPNDL